MVLAMGFDKEASDVGVTICSMNPQDSHFNCLLLPSISSNSCCILQGNKTDNNAVRHGLFVPIAYHSIYFFVQELFFFYLWPYSAEGATVRVLVNYHG